MDKQKQKQYNSTYFHKHKEKEYDRHKKYRDDNPDKVKEYRQKQKKNNTKSKWKQRGLNIDTFYYVYPIYTNTTHCDNCNVFLEGRGKNQKCMDHCHATGMFRNVLCKSCNIKRG